MQGTAADLIKLAMIEVHNWIQTGSSIEGKMIMQVHDELVFDVPQKELEKTTKLVKTVMENVSELSVPLVVDTGHGENWNEAH